MNFYHDDDIPDDLKRYFKPAPQIGMEATPDEHVAKLVEVFREVRRVLREDGILWLNYGDAYAAAPNGSQGSTGQLANRSAAASRIRDGRGAGVPRGLKPKDLIGLPWRLARALQEPYYTGKIKDERDRIWLAAMIDGEGSICGSRHTRSDGGGRRTNVGIFITNTCNAILDEAHRIWPGSRYVHQKPGTDHLGTREVHRWAVHGADGKSALLAELLPHLIAKRRQAVIAWNFLELVKRGRSRTGKTGPQSVEEKARREVLLSVLSDLNKGIDVEMPTWLADPPSMFEPGWWLRSDCIWHKNPMPESIRDRPTKAHEYVFLLSKSARYFYDAEAIKEPATGLECGNTRPVKGVVEDPVRHRSRGNLHPITAAESRNLRTVWTIPTQPTPEAHFATFPEALAERCIKAGTSAHGACSKCMAPWERVVERVRTLDGRPMDQPQKRGEHNRWSEDQNGPRPGNGRYGTRTTEIGWQPTCDCGADVTPCVVLDPFAGSGTTLAVAERLGRDSLGIELNPAYIAMAERRIRAVDPTATVELGNGQQQKSLFGPDQ